VAIIIKRPGVWVGMVLTTLAAGAAAVVSILGAMTAERPTLIVAQKDALSEVLEEAPWFAWEPQDADAPVVWLLTSPGCTTCRTLERTLAQFDADLRLILAAPREAGELETLVAAELARRRDGYAFREWLNDPSRPLPIPAGVLEVDQGTEAVAGYAELGRASFDRLGEIAAANGVRIEAPAVIWRRGREWRIAVRPDAAAVAAVARDVAAQRP